MTMPAAFISINLHLAPARTYLFPIRWAERATVEDSGVWPEIPCSHRERTVLNGFSVYHDGDLHEAGRVGDEANGIGPVALVSDMNRQRFECHVAVRNSYIYNCRPVAHRSVFDVACLQGQFSFFVNSKIHQARNGFQRAVPGDGDLRCDDAKEWNVVLRLIRWRFDFGKELKRVSDFDIHGLVWWAAVFKLSQQQTHKH